MNIKRSLDESELDRIATQDFHQKNAAAMEFERLHKEGSQRFGMLWLQANMLVNSLRDLPYVPPHDRRIDALLSACAWKFAEKMQSDTESKNEGNNEIHLCNEVALTIGGLIQIGYSYEDRNLQSLEHADELWANISAATDAFVLVDTGDYLIPDCASLNNSDDGYEHGVCETYDARYRKYLLSREVWNRVKDDVLKRDREWRDAHMKCKKA